MTPDPTGQVTDWLDRHAPPGPLAVACSGGSDSLALLHLASAWARTRERPLHVLTVDHGLRPESVAETRAVARQAAALGHACETLHWTGPKPTTGLQAAARKARHRLLAQACRARGIAGLMLAHTLDDQAETVWMRLAAGGGWRGAAGMGAVAPSPAWPEGRGLALLRPLLGQRRAALQAWLSGQDVRWIDDPSNADTRYARVRIRQRLADLGAAGFDPARLAALAGTLAALRGAEGRAAWRLARETVEIAPWGGLALDAERLGAVPAAIRRTLLEAAVLAASGRRALPGRAALDRLDAALSERGGATGGGAMLAFWRGRGWLVRDPGAVLGRVDGAGAADLAADGVWDGRFAVARLGPERTAGALGRSYEGLADPAVLSAIPGFARPALMVVRKDGRVTQIAGVDALSGEVQIKPLSKHRFCTRLLADCPADWCET